MLLAALTAAATLTGGRSVDGHPIVAVRSGAADAPRTVLVVGDIHGNERAGRAVVTAIRRRRPRAGTQVWTVASANPDGERSNIRQNAHGVDLNRNFPFRWRRGGRPFATYFPGRHAASEPETRAVQSLVRRLRPDTTIYYHQHMDVVVLPQGGDPAVARTYAQRTRMRTWRLPDCRGTAISWQNARFAHTTAIVVELPAGAQSAASAHRHAQAAEGSAAK